MYFYRKAFIGFGLGCLALAAVLTFNPSKQARAVDCTVDMCFFSAGQIQGLRDTFVDAVNDETVAGDKTFSGSTDMTGGLSIDGTALTATAAEINRAADESANVEVVTETNVITAAESGATFFLNDATEFASTLPAPAAGLRYTFIVTAAPASASYTIGTNGGDNILNIVAMAGGGADAADVATARDVVTFVDSQAVVGDWLYCISDGTSWQCTGMAAVAAGLTTGQT